MTLGKEGRFVTKTLKGMYTSNRHRKYVDFFQCLLPNGHPQKSQTLLRGPKRIMLLNLSSSASM